MRETLRTVVEPIIYSEAADLIAEHKAAGRLVAIVSASPEEIVAPLGEFLGADRVLGTRAVSMTKAATPASSTSTAPALTSPWRWPR